MTYTAAVLGATGNVGGEIVRTLVASPRCARVIVVTRRSTGAFTDPKVTEVVVHMDRLEAELALHLDGVDVALAAFGVGKGSATMADDEVRRIEVAYPLAFCRAAKAAGARVAAVMTAVGAAPDSRVKYARVLGEKERAAESVGFDFLGLYRPGVILGNSNTPGALGYVMPLLHWAMPARYHSVHKSEVARAMVARSERALAELGQLGAPAAPQCEVLEYPEMARYFQETT